MALLYEEESYKIRGACFAVYNNLGGGIKEAIIGRALLKEFTDLGFSVSSQKRIDVMYKEEKVGVYIPDFIIEDKIICELKSKPFISKEDEKQFWGYLKGSNFKLGFLINFGPKKLSIKRLSQSWKTGCRGPWLMN